jgi:3D (Asp-Asp-Asp) domain-containing protein
MAARQKFFGSERRAVVRAVLLITASATVLIVVGVVLGALNGPLPVGRNAAAPPLLAVDPPPIPFAQEPLALPPVVAPVVPVIVPDVEVEFEPEFELPAVVKPEPQKPKKETAKAKPEPEPVMYNGRRLRVARTIRMRVTAYSPDEKSCGKWAVYKTTASGRSVYTNAMHLVAADTKVLPFNSIISIPGYHDGEPVPVLDRGGAIKGNRLDVLYPTDAAARKWGSKWLTVTVWEYVSKK